MNFYQHAKNQAVSSTCFGDMANIEMLESDCLRTFWPISKELDISWIWDLCKNTASSIYFYYWTNSEKINDQIF